MSPARASVTTSARPPSMTLRAALPEPECDISTWIGWPAGLHETWLTAKRTITSAPMARNEIKGRNTRGILRCEEKDMESSLGKWCVGRSSGKGGHGEVNNTTSWRHLFL